MLFLEDAVLTGVESITAGTDPVAMQALFAVLLAAILAILIYSFVWWIFAGFAYMAVARKVKQDMPGLSWIPFVGPLIVAFRTSKMPWWPWLLIIGMFLPWIGFIFSIAFAVFTVVWHWKMFEAINKPGWWSILMLIPIVNFVIIGIAAWSKK